MAENIAARYLEEAGYEVVEKNYRKPWGEIDIVARKEGIVVFVEVKANKQALASGFNPEVRVDRKKIGKIYKTAALYMEYEAGETAGEWQIDIVSVIFDIPNKKAKIRHFKNI